MVLDLYGNYASPPCRAVLLTAKALNLPVNLIQTLPMSPAVAAPEYLKMNPQKTVPTMNDNGLYLNESRGMMQYLANKYGRCDTLYPKVPNERALVDCRLNYDLGTLYARFADAYYPVAFMGEAILQPTKLARLDEGIGFLESYLDQGFAAGSVLTIADIAIVVTLSTIEGFGHPLEKFPQVNQYLQKCKKGIDGYLEINQAGLDYLVGMVKPSLDKARQGK